MSNVLNDRVLAKIDAKVENMRGFVSDEPKRIPRALIGDMTRGDFAALPLDKRLATVRARLIDAEIDRQAEVAAPAAAEPVSRDEPGAQRFRPGEAVRPCACRHCGLYVPTSSRSPYHPGHAPKPRRRAKRDAATDLDVLDVPSQSGRAA